MADQENNNKEEFENLEPVLDEDAFSLDLDDFDLGDDDLEESPGIEPPTLDDVDGFEDNEDDKIGDLVLSSSDNDDDEILDIDLDSDLNLLGEEDPVLHDDEFQADFDEDDEKLEIGAPLMEEDDLELEFDDDIIDLDEEIEAILNGEDGILTNKKKSSANASSEYGSEEEDEGPIALSMEELENITGGLIAEDDTSEGSESNHDYAEIASDSGINLDSEEVLLPEESELSSELTPIANNDLDLELDLDESEVDTQLTFNEDGHPELNLEDDEAGETEFKPMRDAEEEELFGSAKEDENLTLSDDELGNILGSSTESLEESLGSEDDFFEREDLPELEDSKSSMDEEDDGPITLSLEELDNIDSTEEPDTNILDEEPEDETITLSPDELGSIIASEEPTEETESTALDFGIESEEDNVESKTSASESTHEDESSFDIFGDDFSVDDEDDNETETTEESVSSGLEGEYEEDEGPLALSMEELESIAEDAEETSEDELVDSLDRAPLPYEEEQTKPDLLEEDMEDESIALSMEELENITGQDEEDSAGASMVSDGHELELEGSDDADVEVVSGEKIDDLIGEEIPGENLDDIADLHMDEEDEHKVHDFDFDAESADATEETTEDFTLGDAPDLVEHDDLVEFSDEIHSAETREPTLASDDSQGIEIDLDEYAPEGKLSPLEELRANQTPEISEKSLGDAAADAIKDVGSELSVTDRKKVLGYLDNLLGNLPDEVIKEFSKSQYFELYKKMMKELEL